jgi:hypothetical protein
MALIPRSSAAAVPLRPIIAVYHHVRRIYHPCSRLGPWSPEEDEALVQYVDRIANVNVD